MNIYVGNLSGSMREDQLKTMFVEFGEVNTVKIVTDRRSGQSKGYGFVEMPSNSEADQAIKALNGKFIDGQSIKVNPADPGSKRQARLKRKRKSRMRRY